MGIGIGTIGHVDPTTGVIRPQAFDSMHGVNLVEMLAAQHGLPVSVRTGASAAAVGEYSSGSSVTPRCSRSPS